MEFKALFGAEGRTSDFGVSAIFHELQQKMAEWHHGEFMYCHRYSRKGVQGEDVIRAEELERVMVYDACELEQQIKEISKQQKKEFGDGDKLIYREKKSRMKETDFLLPVVTVVLYLGIDHWEGKQKLSELYHIPEEL